MMWLAQRLPVIRVPELLVITAMRYDVVDHDSGRHPAIALTEDAERVLREIRCPRLLPRRRVAALTRRAAAMIELTPAVRVSPLAESLMEGRAFRHG
jgi:hypothetical protein